MKSNIGKTFNNKNTLYTILEQVVTNAIDNYTVSLLVRNNVDFPCFVVAQGLNLATGEWDSGSYPDCMEDAFFEMETMRRISRASTEATAPSLQYLDMLINSLTFTTSDEIVRELSLKHEKKHTLEMLTSKATLLCELNDEISFEDLSHLFSYACDVWLKSDEVALVDVTDFIARIINEQMANVETIININRRDFGYAVLDKDYDIERIINKK